MNKVRMVVFPIKGRNWAFGSRAIDHSKSSSQIPSTFKELWTKISASQDSADSEPSQSNAEITIDFFAHKMNGAWSKLENAPEGSLKSKMHGLGLKLLSSIKPSEILLKSIPKDAEIAEIIYPSSLNPRLVRRRIRHVASRGAILHKKYFYGSLTLLPLTSLLAVLPLPNIPFFWTLYRSYSNWRALKGSEKLLQLVSDPSSNQENEDKSLNISEKDKLLSASSSLVLQPSEELQKLLRDKPDDGDGDEDDDGLSETSISYICERFELNSRDVLKFKHSL